MEFSEIATGIMKANLSEEQIDQLWVTLREKQKLVRAARVALAKVMLTKGIRVYIKGIRPKALEGLEGVVDSIRGQRVSIKLDQPLDSWHPAARFAPGGVVSGLPMSTVIVKGGD